MIGGKMTKLTETSTFAPSPFPLLSFIEADLYLCIFIKKTLFVFFLLQTATTTLIKMAILILYLRTFTTKSFRRAVFILGGLIITNSVALLFGFSFYCVPIAHFWNPSIPGKCINGVVFMTMASGTLLLTDFMIYFLPIPTIWRLNMATRRKMSTTLAFVIGGLCVKLLSPTLQTRYIISKADFW